MHIYTLPRTPGATVTTPWETFCHSRGPFVVIRHSKHRAVSRWQHVDRVRQFSVTLYKRNRNGYHVSPRTWYMTLEQAEKAAVKIVAKETAGWDTAKDDGWKGVRQ